MANRQWYTAIGGQQGGPYTDERLGEMIAASIVRADTFVWCAGMTDWAKAGDVPGLMPRARPAPPPPPRPAPPPMRGARAPAFGQSAGAQGFGQSFGAQNFDHAGAAHSFGQAFSAEVPADAQPLTTHVQMWPLLGRTLLVAIGQVFVIPAPWVMTSFYKWFLEHLELPGQRRASFAGKPMDIWYIFMLYPFVLLYSRFFFFIFDYLLLFLPFYFLWTIFSYLETLAWLLIPAFLALLIVRWVVKNVVWEGQTSQLTFTGGYWPLLGWYVLFGISLFSIVGWAWVQAAWNRWMCHHTEGGNRQLVFIGSGLEILWRTLVFTIGISFIIPIPWVLHWFTRWYVSQFALAERPAA
jgi:GYF domain 2